MLGSNVDELDDKPDNGAQELVEQAHRPEITGVMSTQVREGGYLDAINDDYEDLGGITDAIRRSTLAANAWGELEIFWDGDGDSLVQDAVIVEKSGPKKTTRWGSMAPDYAKNVTPIVREVFLVALHRLLHRKIELNVLRGEPNQKIKILDFGCGPCKNEPFMFSAGSDPSSSAESFPIEVTAVDNSEKMLSQAREKPEIQHYMKRGKLHLRCVENPEDIFDASEEKLHSIEPASQDVVILSSVLMTIPDKALMQRILKMAFKALKPGGSLLISSTNTKSLKQGTLPKLPRIDRETLNEPDFHDDPAWTYEEFEEHYWRALLEYLNRQVNLINEGASLDEVEPPRETDGKKWNDFKDSRQAHLIKKYGEVLQIGEWGSFKTDWKADHVCIKDGTIVFPETYGAGLPYPVFAKWAEDAPTRLFYDIDYSTKVIVEALKDAGFKEGDSAAEIVITSPKIYPSSVLHSSQGHLNEGQLVLLEAKKPYEDVEIGVDSEEEALAA